MIFSLAPMEGITGHVFRRVHAEVFGKMDRYYTPFVTPSRPGTPLGKRYRVELDPRNNRGLDVVPQVLTKSADDFVWVSQQLEQLGYREVNLNLGCPSGTVTAKGKGSGFLRDPDALERFLLDVCERSALPVSVKTRLGFADDSEYEDILRVYCRCPLAELIVHPRVRNDAYRGTPRREYYGLTLERAPFPVAYNGNTSCWAGASCRTPRWHAWPRAARPSPATSSGASTTCCSVRTGTRSAPTPSSA